MATLNAEREQLEALTHAQQTTLAALAEVDEQSLLELTELTLPEIRTIQKEIANVLPVGNLPAMILHGLMQLKGRKVVAERVRQDITVLLRGIDLLPQGLFGVFFAGPAVVLYAYQKLLRLSGKDIDAAFPQGSWQFYLEFGLREDTARHTSETIGFQQTFPHHDNPADEAAAWACAVIDLIYQYHDLLSIDWRERVMLRLIQEQAGAAGLADQPLFVTLSRDWSQARPYRCPPNRRDYLRYRLETFETFTHDRLGHLPAPVQAQVSEQYARRQESLSAYVEQMSLLVALSPEQYQERKESIPFWRACVGLVWQGHTHLIPICQRNAQGSPLCFPPDEGVLPVLLYAHAEGLCDAQGEPLDVDGGGRVWYRKNKQPLGNLRPPTPETVRAQIRTILSISAGEPPSDLDLALAMCPRAEQIQMRESLPEATRAELANLRRAPIILSWDKQSHKQPLAHIRKGHRGIGDHALTLFRTDRSMVFDQSHIFFDGMWGMAIAEIVTNQAIGWYKYFADQPVVSQEVSARLPLKLTNSPEVLALVQKHCRFCEAAAESDRISAGGIRRLRKWLKQRGARLTVNDLLLLYRSFHAAQYTLSESAELALDALRRRVKSSEYKPIKEMIDQTLARFRDINPALLIPVDASNVSPRERLYPVTFRNPLHDLPAVYAGTREAYQTYRKRHSKKHWQAFDEQRRELLAYLKAFGVFVDTLRAVTMRGESLNAATLRLLGHLPPPMQYLLDQIPQRIGVLNEVIKGNEVFSNVGRVAPGSSLHRFISAKDDGSTKELVWGVLSDDEERMRISLRDFRPFVSMLLALGESQLADMLAQDYLDSYVDGFNRFIADLSTLIAVQEPEAGKK